METTIPWLGAMIGAVVLAILVGLFRRDEEGRVKMSDLFAGALAGGVMGGLIAYAAVPNPIPLSPAPVENAAAPESNLAPSAGLPQGSTIEAPKPEAAPAAKKVVSTPKKKKLTTASSQRVNTTPPPGGPGTCREYRTRIMIDGQMQDAYGTSCQQEDGTWTKAQGAQ